MTEKPFSVTELAKEAGVDGSTVRRALIAGEVSGIKIGSTWMIERSEGLRWLSERRSKWGKF